VNFLLATRDTGYRSTALAIAEFVDNALQASARRISVTVAQGADAQLPLEITITDDGVGMDAAALSRALTFGGSSRFNDRHSLGRYGMGLPNGALSRARRVEVYSWQGRDVLWSRLDIDDLAASRQKALAPVEVAATLPFTPSTPTGTVVRLLRCDRLEYKRPSWFARRLQDELDLSSGLVLIDEVVDLRSPQPSLNLLRGSRIDVSGAFRDHSLARERCCQAGASIHSDQHAPRALCGHNSGM